MKRLALVVLFLSILPAWTRAESEAFSHFVSPADFAAAGLSNLSADQLVQLDRLVAAYKSGALAEARRREEQALAAQRAAETRAAQAEVKIAEGKAAQVRAAEVRAAEVKAAEMRAAEMKAAEVSAAQVKGAEVKPVATVPEERGPLAKLRALRTKKAEEPAAVESTLPGKFRGWDAGQVFVLANGQRFQVANGDNYYSPLVENPRVEVSAAALGGYWLRFPDLKTQVRVRLLEAR